MERLRWEVIPNLDHESFLTRGFIDVSWFKCRSFIVIYCDMIFLGLLICSVRFLHSRTFGMQLQRKWTHQSQNSSSVWLKCWISSPPLNPKYWSNLHGLILRRNCPPAHFGGVEPECTWAEEAVQSLWDFKRRVAKVNMHRLARIVCGQFFHQVFFNQGSVVTNLHCHCVQYWYVCVHAHGWACMQMCVSALMH